MASNNLFQDIPVGKTLAVAWVLFTSLFFLYFVSYPLIERSKLDAAAQVGYNNGYGAAVNMAMSSFSGNVLQNGYNNGYGTAVTQLAQALEKQYQDGCTEAVPVTIGTGSVGIVSVDCLQKNMNSASGATEPTKK